MKWKRVLLVLGSVWLLTPTLVSAQCDATTQDDGFEENDDCASAVALGDGTYPGLWVHKQDKDHYAFTVPSGSTLVVDAIFVSANGDVDIFLRDAAAPECGTGNGPNVLAQGFSSNDNENIAWQNTGGVDQDVILEVNVWDNASSPDCNDYDLIVLGSGSGSVGTPFCDPMDNNSTGFPTQLSASFGSGVGSDLHLEVTSGPANQFGVILMGATPNLVGLALGQGRLCVDTTASWGLYRDPSAGQSSVGRFDAGGILQNLSGTSSVGSGFDVPTALPFGGSIQPGQVWHFQAWHRENGGTSNLSNGLTVTF